MTSTHDLATPDLNDPIYTIEHIARLFFVSVDRAREYTYRDTFPAAADLGARNLWLRAAVLAWFEELPRRAKECRTSEPTAAATKNNDLKDTDADAKPASAPRTAAAPRKSARATATAPAAVVAAGAGVTAPQRPIKKYQPRVDRSVR